MLLTFGTPIAMGEVIPKWCGAMMAALAPLLFFAAALMFYRARLKHQERDQGQRRRLRAELRDEILADKAADQYERYAKSLANEQQRSADPFRHLVVSAQRCVINLDINSVMFDVEIKNTYTTACQVWITGEIGLYKSNYRGEPPFATIGVLLTASVNVDSCQMCSPAFPGSLTTEQIATVRELQRQGGFVLANLLAAKAYTPINLMTEPTLTSRNMTFGDVRTEVLDT